MTPVLGGMYEIRLTLDHSRRLKCKCKMGLLSMVMGQVLLLPVGGGPFWDKDWDKGEGLGVLW